MKKYQHLSYGERVLIGHLLKEGLSRRGIAERIGRSAGTVSREIQRNKNREEYVADTASKKYFVRRQKMAYLDRNLKLQSYVLDRLYEGHSPQIIAGRLRAFPELDSAISHESIYAWLYRSHQKKRKLHKLLLRAHHKRGRRKRGSRGKIKHRIGIENREKKIDLREDIGHWEADLIACKRNSQFALVVQERKTRYTAVFKLKSKRSDETLQHLLSLCRKLPQHLIKSITFDNGMEFALHHKLTDEFGIKTFFCDPYSSWQKGGVENMNGRLRRDFPRKTDLTKINDEEFEQCIINHNLTPRKVFGYSTPMETLLKSLGASILFSFKKGVALHV